MAHVSTGPRTGSGGTVGVQPDPDRTELGRAFRERVYGVEVVLETITDADRALLVDDVYEQFGPALPWYERRKHDDQIDEIWRERVERTLEWAVLFDLLERTADGYRIA